MRERGKHVDALWHERSHTEALPAHDRTLSQPGQESHGDVGPRGHQVEETQQETQPLSICEAYKIWFSEQDTEQWEDVEDDDTKQPTWEYSDFRRRESV
jgi:hypothetical protein